MPLWGRKQSKPGLTPADTAAAKNFNSDSNGSIKSPTKPKSMNGGLNSPANIPDLPLPRAPDPQTHPAQYLQSIYAIRERCRIPLEKAKRNQLKHFNVDISKFADTASYVVSIIKVRRKHA